MKGMLLLLPTALLLAPNGLFLRTARAETVIKPRVLLAWERTRFKDQLIEEMKRRLEAQDREVVTAVHSPQDISTLDPAKYDAVFISNSGVNSRVRPWVQQWLEVHAAQGTRIVLHTTQTRAWQVQAAVDTVTSASRIRDVAKLADDYVAQLNTILEKQGLD